jgi:hypothetical protein
MFLIGNQIVVPLEPGEEASHPMDTIFAITSSAQMTISHALPGQG